MNLHVLAAFVRNSGMRKTGVGLYMFTALCYLLALGPLPAKEYVQLVTMLILALYAGNALEHYFTKTEGKDEPTPVKSPVGPGAPLS